MDAYRQQASAPNFDWFDALDDFNRRADIRPQTKRAFERIWRWAGGRAGELKGFTVRELAGALACDPRTAREAFEELLQTYSRKGQEEDGAWLIDVILNDNGIMRLYVYDPRVDIQHRKREPDPQQLLPGFDSEQKATGISAQESPSAPHLRVVGSGNPAQDSPSDAGISAQESPTDSAKNGGDTYTSSSGLNTSKKPPPSCASASDEEVWKEVEEVLRATGMDCWRMAATDARRRDLPPEEILQVIAYWNEHRPAWDAGALFRRLQNHAPGLDVARGWPTKSDRYLRAKSEQFRQHQAQQRQRDEDEERRKQTAEADQAARVEATFGPQLDAMPEDELEQLAREALPLLLLPKFKSHGCSRPGLVREVLLTFLANRSRDAPG